MVNLVRLLRRELRDLNFSWRRAIIHRAAACHKRDWMLRLRDMIRGQTLARFQSDTAELLTLALRADQRLLVSRGPDPTGRPSEVARGDYGACLGNLTRTVYSVALMDVAGCAAVAAWTERSGCEQHSVDSCCVCHVNMGCMRT
jgi:hypothetical protein